MFAHLGPGDDYVLDHIIFDPAHSATIYVAGWSLYNADEGDVFRSDDGGSTWRTLKAVHGKSIRALSMAPSKTQRNPKVAMPSSRSLSPAGGRQPR